MSEHYYTAEPSSAHDEREIRFRVLGRDCVCVTDASTFSRDGLDMGTRIMLEAAGIQHGRVLDLGCGWGPVGVALGKSANDIELTLSDINLRSVELAKRNLEANGVRGAAVLQSDGFENISGLFDAILLNPPIRTGKAVIYRLFREALSRLEKGGTLYIVIRKQQGAESAVKYLEGLGAKVDRIAREKGYWVLACTEADA